MSCFFPVCNTYLVSLTHIWLDIFNLHFWFRSNRKVWKSGPGVSKAQSRYFMDRSHWFNFNASKRIMFVSCWVKTHDKRYQQTALEFYYDKSSLHRWWTPVMKKWKRSEWAIEDIQEIHLITEMTVEVMVCLDLKCSLSPLVLTLTLHYPQKTSLKTANTILFLWSDRRPCWR